MTSMEASETISNARASTRYSSIAPELVLHTILFAHPMIDSVLSDVHKVFIALLCQHLSVKDVRVCHELHMS